MEKHADDRATASAVSQQDWLCDMVRILASRSLWLHIEQLEQLLWELRFPGNPMPARFPVQVQGIISRYASQSAVFRQRKARLADDLFFSPEGKGSGTWAVHPPQAQAWLKRRRRWPKAPAATVPDGKVACLASFMA